MNRQSLSPICPSTKTSNSDFAVTLLRFQDLIEAERGPVLVAVDALVMV
jgi:hypothetical protein